MHADKQSTKFPPFVPNCPPGAARGGSLCAHGLPEGSLGGYSASPGRARTPAAERGRTAAAGALGIYAKTASAPPLAWVDVLDEAGERTGEVLPFRHTDDGLKPYVSPQAARAERYMLKSVVNRILPRSRTSKCHRWRVPKQSLRVLRSIEHGKAFYAGLQVCGSVWLCPVCGAKITERRRGELVAAVGTAKAMEWQVMLLTLTVPHGMGDDLKAMLDQMMLAWRKTSSTRAGAKVRGAIGLEGTVRVLEVTDGENGFHPHFHVLLFLSSDVTTAGVEDLFRPLWQDACVKAGLPRPSDKHGVRVDDGSHAAAYASKWGLESEMTKGHTKKGNRGSMTPWDMLRDVLANRSERSSKRFAVYADAFHGRRQLYWSNGLKSKLGVQDFTDEEIAAYQEDQAHVLAELTDDQWRAVLSSKCEAAVLDIAENNPGGLVEFLSGLVGILPSLKAGEVTNERGGDGGRRDKNSGQYHGSGPPRWGGAVNAL